MDEDGEQPGPAPPQEEEDTPMEEAEEDDDGDEDGEDEQEDAAAAGPSEVFLPGRQLEEDEELVVDESAYVMFHQAHTGEDAGSIPGGGKVFVAFAYQCSC